MTSRTVQQYRCDFCGKKLYSASWMKRHEQSCTLNPNRICKICAMSWGDSENRTQRPMDELLATIPKHPKDYWEKANSFTLSGDCPIVAEIAASLPALRKAANNCPGCIMSALRQAGIKIPTARDFNFTNEMKAIWEEINERSQEDDALG